MADLIKSQQHFLLDPEFCDPRDYSQLALFFSAIPWMTYAKGPVRPDFLQRSFTFEGRQIDLIISGARLKENDPVLLPGVVEERVLDALIKFAADGHLIEPENDQHDYGVHFSVYQLQQHLRQHGHTYQYDRLNLALERLASTILTLIDPSTKKPIRAKAPVLSGLQIHERQGHCFARFNWIITQAIRDSAYRLYNYKILANLHHNTARWIARRLYGVFKQASIGTETKTYHFTTSFLINGSPFQVHSRGLRRNAQEIEEALEILTVTSANHNGILTSWTVDNGHDHWNDPLFEVIPSPEFVADARRANALTKRIRTVNPPPARRLNYTALLASAASMDAEAEDNAS